MAEVGERSNHPHETTLAIREAAGADASRLLEFKCRLDGETSFMLVEPNERTESVEQVAVELAAASDASNFVVLLAFLSGSLVGYVQAIGGQFRRNHATARIVIGVLASAGGQGIGSMLFDRLDSWATASGIHRLELTVQAHNDRAIRLYQRKGFTVEGRRRECLMINGEAIDELYMAKLIENSPSANASE